MKSCPSCNRTFEDTLTYCLVDGAILSAPFDPQATIRIPATRETSPAPTEVLSREGVSYNTELPPTIQASPQLYSPPILRPAVIPEQNSSLFLKRVRKGAKIGLAVGIPIGFYIGFYFIHGPFMWANGLLLGGLLGAIIGAVIVFIGRLLSKNADRILSD